MMGPLVANRMAYANPQGGAGLKKLLEILGLFGRNTVDAVATNPMVQSIAKSPVRTLRGINPDVQRPLRHTAAYLLQKNPVNPMTKPAAFTAVNQPSFKQALSYVPGTVTAAAAAPVVMAAMPSQTEEEKFLEYLMQNGGMV